MNDTQRMPHLDGLRGVASVMVLLNHLALCVIPSISTLRSDALASPILIEVGRSPLSAAWGGDFGVCIFFALSGFVLAQFADAAHLSLPSMLARRYVRLALPMLASALVGYLLLKFGLYRNLAAAASVSHSEWQAMWYRFAPSLTAAAKEGVFGAFISGRSDYNSNLWTMRIELIGSAAIFLLYALPARPLWRLAILLVALILFRGYYPLFAVGAALFELHRLATPLVDKVRPRHREAVAAAFFLAAVFAGGFPASGTRSGIVSPWHQWLSNSDNALGWHMVGASLMMVAALYSHALAAVLASRPGRTLGRLSFPIYLIQIPLLCSLTSWLMIRMASQPYEWMATATIPITVIATLIAADVMSRVIELPSLKLSRRIGFVVESLRAYAKPLEDYWEIGSANWFERRAFRLCGLRLETAAMVRPLRPESSVRLGLCWLMAGGERRAANYLRAAAEVDAFYWNSDLDIPRRPSVDNTARPQDTCFGDQGLLFAGYNLAAMRAFQVGAGHLSTRLAERAVEEQPRLRRIARPGAHASNYLSTRGLRLEELRILPFSWVSQIGHLGMLDLMLRMRRLGWWSGTAVALAPPSRVANQSFLSLLSAQPDVITVTDPSDSPLMLDFEALLRSHGLFYHVFRPPGAPVVRWHEAAAMAFYREAQLETWTLAGSYDAQFAAQPRLQEQFRLAMSEWGIGKGDWYVCLHLRELGHHSAGVDFGQANRNAAFASYLEAIRFIVSKGGRVIKMGSPSAPAAPEVDGLIDYPHTAHRSEAMDIALIRHARYFIGTTSGLANVAISLGIPAAQVNCLTTEYQPWSSSVRFCPKPIRTRTGQMLTQRQVTSKERWWLATAQSMADGGLVAEDNTPDEILETVREIDALAAGQQVGPNEILGRWREHLAAEHAYGAALPSTHFLNKHAAAFLPGNVE